MITRACAPSTWIQYKAQQPAPPEPATESADTNDDIKPLSGLDNATPLRFPVMDAPREILDAGGDLPANRNQLKKWVVQLYRDTQPKNISNEHLKRAQEQMEAAIVSHLRDAYVDMKPGSSEQQMFDYFVAQYQSQPAMSIRTSTSVANQAYSTPSPLAFIAGKMSTALDTNGTVSEPTAGNGMLALGRNPRTENDTTRLNEIDDYRATLLRAQGYQVTTQDAVSRFYLAPMGSWGFFNDDDDALDLADSRGFHPSIGKPINDYFSFDIFGSYFSDIDLEATVTGSLESLFGLAPVRLQVYGKSGTLLTSIWQ